MPGQNRIWKDEWRVYEVQKFRFVVAVWEVRARLDMRLAGLSSYNEAGYRTCDMANEIVKSIPEEPPNPVGDEVVKDRDPK